MTLPPEAADVADGFMQCQTGPAGGQLTFSLGDGEGCADSSAEVARKPPPVFFLISVPVMASKGSLVWWHLKDLNQHNRDRSFVNSYFFDVRDIFFCKKVYGQLFRFGISYFSEKCCAASMLP